MILRRIDILLLITVLIISSGCSRPESDYGFIAMNPYGTDTRDTLSFSLDMSDSTAVYEISFASRLVSDFKYNPLEVKVIVTSPSGNIYSENIALPTDYKALKKSGANVSHSAGTYDVEWGYRSNITPAEYGIWKMDLLILDPGARENYIIKGIYAFGANCRKEDEHQK